MKSPLAPAVELEFFRQLWKKSNAPFWLCECCGNDFIVTATNPAEGRIDPRIRPGVSIRSLIGFSAEADMLLSGYFECRDTGRTVNFRQQPSIDGEERLFQTLLVPITDAQGNVTHICGTSQDLTQFLKAQNSLEELNRQLEERVSHRTQALNQANEDLRKANLVLEKLALQDNLTELANRRHFFERATEEVLRSQRYGRPLSLQMIDIDHFKAINDRFGHAAGDDVLRTFSKTIRSNLRHNDFAARIGGEEFVILLPETGIEDARHHAERLRRAVESNAIPFGEEPFAITVSIGVAGLDAGEFSPDPMLMRADNSLYQAKKNGRNQVQAAMGGQVGNSTRPL